MVKETATEKELRAQLRHAKATAAVQLLFPDVGGLPSFVQNHVIDKVVATHPDVLAEIQGGPALRSEDWARAASEVALSDDMVKLYLKSREGAEEGGETASERPQGFDAWRPEAKMAWARQHAA